MDARTFLAWLVQQTTNCNLAQLGFVAGSQLFQQLLEALAGVGQQFLLDTLRVVVSRSEGAGLLLVAQHLEAVAGADVRHGERRARPHRLAGQHAGREDLGGHAALEVVVGNVFEGLHGVYVGAPSRQPYRVFRLSNPARVVVDIAHP